MGPSAALLDPLDARVQTRVDWPLLRARDQVARAAKHPDDPDYLVGVVTVGMGAAVVVIQADRLPALLIAAPPRPSTWHSADLASEVIKDGRSGSLIGLEHIF
jgi:hypothetical protein